MGKSDAYESAILRLYFLAQAIAGIADNAASAPATLLYVSIYTGDPQEGGSPNTECTYTGYGRVAVARSAAGWTESGGVVNPAAAIEFPPCSANPGNPVTHFGVSKTPTGAPDYFGTCAPNVTMAVGVVPRLTTASAISED